VERFEVVERKFFGRPVKAIKVYCKNPDVIPKYAKLFEKSKALRNASKMTFDIPCAI
jgi:DNA polymerase elongation subunit (family B)